MYSFFFLFFLLKGKYHFRNKLLRLTRCVKQTWRPLKSTSMAKKGKNMKAENNLTWNRCALERTGRQVSIQTCSSQMEGWAETDMKGETRGPRTRGTQRQWEVDSTAACTNCFPPWSRNRPTQGLSSRSGLGRN